ncbi:type I toxin-antitoxin system SymE family toxin [Xanthomonas translucens pv. secalis]|nr:type I toxin-antitoxin system SymE family toxin [Xanthomonas translucens pv. undulosa]UKE45498.1 type I toxin-antitoxin system SymE family toxin [Xanthomonas translucens pv. secalis]QSQ54706.1 type I toxin-antitoxin system SymE family toxin [Xanthomonas translucens pv. undulosa]QSQ58500.1 type I toxin-antitoxin system SymE family toxin [Xanthomonas translucens pv. undulosa]QSQ62040.1 type I toxin-antitoxin system SymE family toxin [Xanthomonas translucens pv. undulosa]
MLLPEPPATDTPLLLYSDSFFKSSPPYREWTIVEPTLSPILTAEEVAAADSADLARASRAPRHPRTPQQCTAGYGHYPASNQHVPMLRLRGRWLEQLGFAIGCTLRITVRDHELEVTVADED